MNLGWHFKRLEFGDTHAGVLLRPLSGSTLPPEHLLAREAIQNSVDARRKCERVKVSFRQESADSDRLTSIGGLLGLFDYGGPVDRKRNGADLGLGSNDFFDAQLDSSANPQSVLYIEDYGTSGLGGPSTNKEWGDLNSRYYRLVDGSGVLDDSDVSRGGSFGLGKSVYWSSSNAKTVAFYSVFEPSEQTDGTHARFIVAGLYNTHNFGGVPYSGRAWFGDLNSDVPCAPLTDQDAHHMASQLGFKARSPVDLGTSVLILGSNLTIGGIREGVENHWWPGIVDGDLKVELSDQGQVLHPPDPLASKRLAHYVRAYLRAEERVDIESETTVVEKFRKSGDREVGWCAVVEAETADFPIDDDNPHDDKHLYPNINGIAFIRSPRMVVCYHKLPASPMAQGVVGAYVADDDIDHILKLSEPSDHTGWSSTSQRLNSDQQVLVRGIPNRVRRTAQRLRDRIAGEQTDDLSSPRSLEQLMGRLLNTRKGGPSEVTSKPRDPFQVRTKKHRRWYTSGASIEVIASIGVRPTHDSDEVVCAVTLGAFILRDDTLANDNRVEVVNVRVNGEAIDYLDPWNPHFDLSLSKGQPAEVQFTTSRFPEYAASRISIETVLVKEGMS